MPTLTILCDILVASGLGICWKFITSLQHIVDVSRARAVAE